jgi:DNA-binding PadR family transcriptional regulator
LHGTAIMEEVLDRTEGDMRLWPGTLYGSLRDLADAGLVRETEPPDDAPTEGGRRRFYEVTTAGRAVLAGEVARLESWIRVARARGLEPA